MIRRHFLLTGLGAGLAAAAGTALYSSKPARAADAAPAQAYPVSMSDADWHKRLTPAQYSVLREEGTERPFTSPLLNEHRHGVFACAACGQAAYSSDTKFDSGTGWPSFWQPLPKAIATTTDTSFGMVRNEVHCSRCGSHLGHVFDDGPKPTGLRYCMNGVAMTFRATTA